MLKLELLLSPDIREMEENKSIAGSSNTLWESYTKNYKKN